MRIAPEKPPIHVLRDNACVVTVTNVYIHYIVRLASALVRGYKIFENCIIYTQVF